MDIRLLVEGEIKQTLGPKYKVEIEKGQRGTYAWKITVRSNNADDCLNETDRLDQSLRRVYTLEEKEKRE